MQFRNKSDDTRELTLDGVRLSTVECGQSIDVTAEQAAGLVLQCGPDGAWEPADEEAAAAVAKATAPPVDDEASVDEAASTDTTEPAAPKAKPRARRSAE